MHKKKPTRFLYWIELDNGLFKIGMTKNYKQRFRHIKNTNKSKTLDIIRLVELPYQCVRCAENAIAWGVEYFDIEYIEHVNCFFEKIHKSLEGKKCKHMYSTKKRKEIKLSNSQCQAFKFEPFIIATNILDDYITPEV